MGLTHAEILLINSADEVLARRGIMRSEDVRQMTVRALVDSGANMLIINQVIADQLDLVVHDSTEVELADGTHNKWNIVGPIMIRFKNRSAICSAVVIPGANEVLLGAVPMEAMDVIIDPVMQQLVVHPDRPDRAGFKAK
jgi:clan AA aspartic protease